MLRFAQAAQDCTATSSGSLSHCSVLNLGMLRVSKAEIDFGEASFPLRVYWYYVWRSVGTTKTKVREVLNNIILILVPPKTSCVRFLLFVSRNCLLFLGKRACKMINNRPSPSSMSINKPHLMKNIQLFGLLHGIHSRPNGSSSILVRWFLGLAGSLQDASR